MQKKEIDPALRKKLEEFMEIEKKVQKKWQDAKIFEEDVTEGDPASTPDNKYFVTFPYPYMNGRLHIGHAFSLSKAEFAARFHRMMGKKTLFPMGFHCTGMPIAAAANKLQREFEGEDTTKKSDGKDEDSDSFAFKSRKSKTVSKSSGKSLKQSEIMVSMGIPEEEVMEFRDPQKWIRYFPDKAKKDLQAMGCAVDWRRSFITTDVNGYYDSFIRWQFNRLKAKGKISFGKRPSIFSPLAGQPCLDHERSTGEGVLPQEYTLVKIEILKDQKLPEIFDEVDPKGRFFLGAATLRPETMYGQTNCWVLPKGEYVIMKDAAAEGEYLIISYKAAYNLSFQDHSTVFGKPDIKGKVMGENLIGLKLRAPLTPYKVTYSLPLMTISMDKGTGIVTSVPSDAPDDYRAFEDLRENQNGILDKYNIDKETMLDPFAPIEIIEIDGFKTKLAAVEMCKKMGIKNQYQAKKLKTAKKEVYLKGFYEGKMLVEEYKGMPVASVKDLVKEKLIASGDAIVYSEPEKEVISREGDVCVVAYTDQWYIDYGEEEWKDTVRKHVEKMETYHKETKSSLLATLEWLKQWACSRTFGLGTKIPWDQKWLIESLSDSTIYMAYYTVSHLLHTDLRGEVVGPAGLKVEDMTDAVWDYIFLGIESDEIDKERLKPLRDEFKFWYPLDLRTSGKDLVRNHLTFWLYNHTAIWDEEPDLWPRAVRANGHVMLDGNKMSKSTGNFLTVKQSIKKFSSDGLRLGLADSGDSTDDANFSFDFVQKSLDKLFTLRDFFIEHADIVKNTAEGDIDSSEMSSIDRIFKAKMDKHLKDTREAYENMLFKAALKSGFFEFVSTRKEYIKSVGGIKNANPKLLRDYMVNQVLVLAPITPHFCEHIWSDVFGLDGFVSSAKFPAVYEYDTSIIDQERYINKALNLWSMVYSTYLKRSKGVKPKKAKIFTSRVLVDWQMEVKKLLRENYDEESKAFKKNKGQLIRALNSLPAVKKLGKRRKIAVAYLIDVMNEALGEGGAQALQDKPNFDEAEVLKNYIAKIKNRFDLDEVEIYNVQDGGFEEDKVSAQAISVCEVLKPGIALY